MFSSSTARVFVAVFFFFYNCHVSKLILRFLANQLTLCGVLSQPAVQHPRQNNNIAALPCITIFPERFMPLPLAFLSNECWLNLRSFTQQQERVSLSRTLKHLGGGAGMKSLVSHASLFYYFVLDWSFYLYYHQSRKKQNKQTINKKWRDESAEQVSKKHKNWRQKVYTMLTWSICLAFELLEFAKLTKLSTIDVKNLRSNHSLGDGVMGKSCLVKWRRTESGKDFNYPTFLVGLSALLIKNCIGKRSKIPFLMKTITVCLTFLCF